MELKELQNKHKDEIIFIIGGGPSVRNVDVNILKKYTVMAVNSGILAVPFANYMIGDDSAILNWSYCDNLKELNCICLFYEKKFKNSIKFLPKDRVAFYQHKSWFSPPATYNLPDGLILTKDITKPIIGSRTSMSSSLHLAYCMGAKVIVLLGNDCQFSKDGKNYRYFWQYWKKEDQPYRHRGTHFNKRTQSIGFDQKSFVEYWNYFAKINKKVNIIDASDSCLNCFPKMTVKEVLEKYSQRRKNEFII